MITAKKQCGRFGGDESVSTGFISLQRPQNCCFFQATTINYPTLLWPHTRFTKCSLQACSHSCLPQPPSLRFLFLWVYPWFTIAIGCQTCFHDAISGKGPIWPPFILRARTPSKLHWLSYVSFPSLDLMMIKSVLRTMDPTSTWKTSLISSPMLVPKERFSLMGKPSSFLWFNF